MKYAYCKFYIHNLLSSAWLSTRAVGLLLLLYIAYYTNVLQKFNFVYKINTSPPQPAQIGFYFFEGIDDR